jgi:hypothetical protein
MPSRARLLFEKIKSMNANQDISIGVDLQEVSKVCIEPEAANGKAWIVVEQHNLCGMQTTKA